MIRIYAAILNQSYFNKLRNLCNLQILRRVIQHLMFHVKSDGTQLRTSSDSVAGEWKMLSSAVSTGIADRADRSNSATIDLERKCACAQGTVVN